MSFERIDQLVRALKEFHASAGLYGNLGSAEGDARYSGAQWRELAAAMEELVTTPEARAAFYRGLEE
jgi:hypothetical protein